MKRGTIAALRRVDAARKLGRKDDAKQAAKQAIRAMEKRR